jgi:uncharacterized membrane protein
MKHDWRTELPCWLVLAAMFALAATTWPGSPVRLPVHWGLDFQPDRYGGRFEALLALPLTALLLYLAITLFPRIDPARSHYASFAGAYLIVRFAVLAFLLAVYVLMLRAFRVETPVGPGVVPVFAGVLLMVLGFAMRKLRPNWLMGIRTPWTLSSPRSWEHTHRVGSVVFMACGALIALSTLGGVWALLTAVGIFAAATLAVSIYSYFLWRDDPQKIPPGGHWPA